MQKRTFSELEKYQVLQPILRGLCSLSERAVRTSLAPRTLRRWRQQVLTDGLPGLTVRLRRDRGQGHRLTPALKTIAEDLALARPTATAVMIHRCVARYAQQCGLPMPAYRTVHHCLSTLDRATLTLARHGMKTYRQQFELAHRFASQEPNGLWQVDHTRADIHVKGDGNTVTRPWLTVVLDDYSRAICGYLLSTDAPSAAQTALALRQAIWIKMNRDWSPCGIPHRLYTDNGSDFVSKHLEEICLRLHIETIRSKPGRPQGRGKIERFFDTLNQGLLCALPGYGKGLPPTTTDGLLTFAQLDRHLEQFVVHHYNQHPHRETQQAPQARWQAGGFLPRMPESIDALDDLLLHVREPRKVQRDGISFGGFRYVATTLMAYVGELVSIRYDPRDLAEIRVYYDEELICRAMCPELEGSTLSLKEVKDARQRILRQRKARIKKAHQHLTDLGISEHELEWVLGLPVNEVDTPLTPLPDADSPVPLAASTITEESTLADSTPTSGLKRYRYGHRN